MLAPAWCSAQSDVSRILLGFPAGASGDTITRKIADKLRDSLGETFIVENKPGAGGRLALEDLKQAKPDGKTMILTPLTPLTAAPWLYTKLRYDAFKDFQPIAHIANFKYIFVVGPQSKAKTLKDFVAQVRADPKLGFYSAASPGSGSHMAVDAFARAAGIDMTFVGYKGTANAVNDLIGGQLPSFMGNVADFVQFAKQGRVHVLGVANAERSKHMPQVATFKEQGFDIQAGGWFAMYVPAGTPAPIVDRLSKAVIAAVQSPDVKALAETLGLEVTGYGPKKLAEIQRSEYELTGSRIKASGFKIEE
jgi:tripartite-type tricarboxylate transporter receptor subunit TctC